MRILVVCEFSGRVRRAFRKKGHFAYSCDILPSEDNSPYHFQEKFEDFYEKDPNWDLIIAHPPCTYLCNSGVRHLYIEGKKENGRDLDRWEKMRGAAKFFSFIWNCAIVPRICIENPIMHGYAQNLIGVKPTQKIQPWQFGHGSTKSTYLWLKNLPLLKPTDIVGLRSPDVHFASGLNRWKDRSRTIKGIASAMAEQWGDL